MQIRSDQIAQLRAYSEKARIDQRTTAIAERIRAINPELFDHPASKEIDAIREAVLGALHYEIDDFDDQCQWAYIFLMSGHKFWQNPQFRNFLDDPLFHPKSKARNIVTSFRIAVKAANRQA